MGTVLLIVLLFGLLVAATVGVLSARMRRWDATARPSPARRPWWGIPSVWVGVAALSIVLGLFVAPRLFGFAFLLLPLVWISGLDRRRDERHGGES